jgi:hypothetical protein
MVDWLREVIQIGPNQKVLYILGKDVPLKVLVGSGLSGLGGKHG